MSKDPNGERPDDTFTEFQLVAEGERDYSLLGQPGKLRVTGFDSRARMGDYADALRLAAQTGAVPSVLDVRRYHGHAGIDADLEQQITPDLGVFLRVGANDGHQQAYEFTDVNRTISGGASLAGKRWGRADDTVGLAGVVNDISRDFKAYLAAGGLGILIGDGRPCGHRAGGDPGDLLRLGGGQGRAPDLRLPVRRAPRLQRGPWADLGARRAAARGDVIATVHGST